MSIGQRIAQKRKEMGISQEMLGERMGVSRQAIYKWESDTALPEIEKLVSLSKLFGVSVGWLLGVEEDAAPQQEEPDSLNQEQLDMVEQIVRRYIEAQPQPKPRRKWPWVLVACVLVVVFVQLFLQMDRLSNQYNNLQNSVGNISYSVNSQINGIAGRVEEILKAQNNLTAEYSCEIVSTDYRNHEVTIGMQAVPKTYSQGMSAVFVVDCGNGPEEFAGSLVDGHTFTCQAKAALTDSITVSVVFVSADGTRQTQVLESYARLLSDSYAELSISDYDLMHTRFADGKLALKNWYVTVWDGNPGNGGAKITEYRLGVFQNQKLVGWAEPCDKPANYIGDFTDGQFFKMPDLVLEGLEAGETLTVAALATDSYGRQYMCFDVPYLVVQEEDSTYSLTWPDTVLYDRDPANWTLE